jgi:lipopolysaccharide transport system permease protein
VPSRFQGVEATAEDAALRLRFRLDRPSPLCWQVLDPATGAILAEGQRLQGPGDAPGGAVDMHIELPPEDGPYRVTVAPVEDRAHMRMQMILIDGRIAEGRLDLDAPQFASASGLRLAGALRAVPKAFVYPARSIWTNRKLIGSMVRRDILSRSRGSFGGAMWAFLNPLLLMATYFFVFGVILQTKFGEDTSRTGYVLYFLAGMLPWLPFSEAVGRSPYVVIEHRNFVKKLVFPLETLPVNLVIAGAVTEVFALAIFVAGVVAARGSVPWSVVWLPALILPQLLLAAGLCWFLSALGVFVRDLGQIIGFLLTLWFFLTPICYPESQKVPAAVAHILEYNPILVLVRGYRAIFLEGHAPALGPLAALWIGSGIVALLGHAWFHRLRRSFADVI